MGKPAALVSAHAGAALPATVGFMDIGTNSIRLLVARFGPRGAAHTLIALKETIRLGEEVFSEHRLSPAAMARAVFVVRQFAAQAREAGASELIAVATSASREAENQQEFLYRLRDEAGVEVHVISGREEARLIYLGVASGVHLGARRAFMVDIGGGSTEISVGTQANHLYLNSLRLGAIRMSSRFLHNRNGPVPQRLYDRLRRFVRDEASTAIAELGAFDIDVAIGSSGTIENLAEVASLMFPGARRDVLRFADLERVIAHLRSLPLAERRLIPGLNPARADIIIGGAAILHVLMEELSLREVRISTRALRDGLVADYRLHHGHHDAGESVRHRSVHQLGRHCGYDEVHAGTTARLALELFDSAASAGLHSLGNWERELLEYAALLHHIGAFVGYNDYHKHSEYLVRNAELLGFDELETNIVGLVVRHHRNGLPRRRDHALAGLSTRHREAVRALSMFLRLAENLDRTQTGVVESARLRRIDESKVALHIVAGQGWQADLWGLPDQAGAFKKTFGRQIVFDAAPVPALAVY